MTLVGARAAAIVVGLTVLVARTAIGAEPPVDEAQGAEIDALRAEVASQIQLQAFDLLDEVVFDWMQHPLFSTETPVVLADVSVPLSLGTGLQALIENHFASLLIHNPTTKMTLTHCPQCTAIIVHSGSRGTVVSRGIDAPETLARAGETSGSRHAVFLDFEAEGSSLVLRVRITRLSPELPIVFAKTLSTATSTAALLRNEEHLVSAADARKEYVDALESHGLVVVPMRIVIRSYTKGKSDAVAAPPSVWLQGGVEVGLTQARAWTASFSVGFTWLPDLHDGLLAQARFSRLLSGKTRSLTHPDLYFFLAGTVMTLHGTDASLFSQQTPNVGDIIASATGAQPRETFGAWQAGLELRIKNRIGLSIFLESLPALTDAPALGNFIDLSIVKFQTIGGEVSFWF